MSINSRFAVAYAAMGHIKPLSFAEASPAMLDSAVAFVTARTEFDFASLSKSLFPTGLVTDLDPVDSGWVQEWQRVRGDTTPIITKALMGYLPGANLVIDEMGVKATVPAAEMASLSGYDRDAICDIFAPLGLGITQQDDGSGTRMVMATNRQMSHASSDTKYEHILDALYRLLDRGGVDRLSGWPYLVANKTINASNVGQLVDFLRWGTTHSWNDTIKQATRAFEMDERQRNALLTPPTPPRGQPDVILKSRVEAGQALKNMRTSRADFAGRPFLGRRAKGAKASRQYGIELEVIDAGDLRWPDEANMNEPGDLITARTVALPPKWERVRDGSLRHQIGDGHFYDPWEFVSPPLQLTYDPGMEQVCKQVDWTVPYAKAGVHVHVDATNAKGKTMTTSQVNRLLEIYAQVSPLLPPILYRSTAEFCLQMDFEEWAAGWWSPKFTAPKKPHRLSRAPMQSGPRKQNAIEVITERINQYSRGKDKNWGRYREVNLESLVKHGTIEFRAMGSIYGFEYLARWAWLCREMTNYAQNDSLPVAPFYRFTTLGEVIDHIEQFAVERLNPVKEVKNVRNSRVLSRP